MQQQIQNLNNPNICSSTSCSSKLDTTFNISSSANTVQDNTVILDLSNNYSAHPQETVGLTKYSFCYKPPNDFQIYNITCKETPISFELVSQLLNNNNNSTQNYVRSNNLHEFHFLKPDEKKCYKITCELISHSSIVRFLNKNVYDNEVKQNEHLQQEYVDFTKEIKEKLEFYLKQVFKSLK